MKKRILIIGSAQDNTVDYLATIYSQRSYIFRFDADRVCDYNFQLNEHGWSIDNYREFVIDTEVDAIIYRRPFYPHYERYDENQQAAMKRDMDILIRGMLKFFEGKCITRPEILDIAENVVSQLYLAKKVGFNLPDGLVANNQRCIDSLMKDQKFLIRRVGSGKHTNASLMGLQCVEPEDYIKPLPAIEIKPTYFQRKIDKDYSIIATFLREHVYVARIDREKPRYLSDAKGAPKISEEQLPEDIQEKCYKYMKEIDIELLSFYFVVKDNVYYFTKADTEGQWLWLENNLGWDLSIQLMEYLNS